MLLAVTDTETTGNGETDQVVELAVVHINPGDPGSPGPSSSHGHGYHSLACPTVPVSLEARAVHHLGPEELEDAPSFREMMDSYQWPFRKGGPDEVVLVAHNAEYDTRLLTQTVMAYGEEPSEYLPARYICTWRCAQHLYPDSPKHGNQVLRYYLDLDNRYGPIVSDLPPHRAMPDAEVTAWLLSEMLTQRSAEDLIILTQQPILHKVCRMPAHAGKLWADLAETHDGRSYMQWVLRQGPKRKLPSGAETGFDEDMIYTMQHHLGLL